jgi:hypothetical protein
LKPSTLLRPQTAIKKINRKPNEINGLAGHPYASARSPTVTFDNENKSTPSKVRYRGLAKNATRAFTALALANIYLSRSRLMTQVRP